MTDCTRCEVLEKRIAELEEQLEGRDRVDGPPELPPSHREGDFPNRVLSGSLIRAVYEWAERQGRDPEYVDSRQQLAEWVLHTGQQELADSSLWKPFALSVLREVYEQVAGEPLETEANKHLQRLVNLAGPHHTLRLLVEALEAGAGLGEGHEDDPRSVIKYAVAIWRGRRRDDQ